MIAVVATAAAAAAAAAAAFGIAALAVLFLCSVLIALGTLKNRKRLGTKR